MEKSLYKYILKYSMRQQIVLLLLIFAGYPVIYIGFNLPKLIINDAIGGGEGPRMLLGLALDQLGYLFVLCMVFLLVVLTNGGIKYCVNVYRGMVGERLLRRLRYQLIQRMLRFPLPIFSKMSQGEVISMVTLEVEKMGKFMGESISLPAFQGGILLTSITFLMIENWIMGIAAMALYPIQIYLIPKLQVSVNELEAGRIQLVRNLSSRIGETMSCVQEIHAHDATQYELADYSQRLGNVFALRFAIFKKKFFIKFFNNFLAQLGPFFFYLVGGYLVITGQLTVGGLVAMLSAHKEMYTPWKEILNYYQQKEEARIKYEQVISQFQPVGLLTENAIGADEELAEPLNMELSTSGLTHLDDNDNPLLESISLKLNLTEHIAIVGPSGSGKRSLTMILAGLVDYSQGQVNLGSHNIRDLSESVTGRKIAFADQSAYLFTGSLWDNICFSLKHRPVHSPAYGDSERKKREGEVQEAELSGNSTYDIQADWIDYQAVGVASPQELIGEIVRILRIVKLDDNVFQFGLRGVVDPESDPGISTRLLEVRRNLREKLQDPTLAKYVEPFDPERYNTNATLVENLIFGTPVGTTFNLETIAEHPHMRFVLQKTGLEDTLVEMGYNLAVLMLELFSDVDADNQNYQQFSFLDVEALPEYQALCARVEKGAFNTLNEQERIKLMTPTFKLIPARHRLGLIDDKVQQQVLKTRAIFREKLPQDQQKHIAFFHPEVYNTAGSVQDNILFGKLAHGQANAVRYIGELLSQVIDEAGMYETIIRTGLATRIGLGGVILSSAQQQKVTIARCLLKRPDLFVLYQSFYALEGPERREIGSSLREELKGRGIIAALRFPSMAEHFDRVVVIQRGVILETGTYAELSNNPNSHLSELLQNEKLQA